MRQLRCGQVDRWSPFSMPPPPCAAARRRSEVNRHAGNSPPTPAGGGQGCVSLASSPLGAQRRAPKMRGHHSRMPWPGAHRRRRDAPATAALMASVSLLPSWRLASLALPKPRCASASRRLASCLFFHRSPVRACRPPHNNCNYGSCLRYRCCDFSGFWL